MITTLGRFDSLVKKIIDVNDGFFDGATMEVSHEEGNFVITTDNNLGEVLADSHDTAKQLLMNGCSIAMSESGSKILIPIPVLYQYDAPENTVAHDDSELFPE
jgi:hypothetical protein